MESFSRHRCFGRRVADALEGRELRFGELGNLLASSAKYSRDSFAGCGDVCFGGGSVVV